MVTPLISVIVPVYNNESYLSRCVNSIIGQTYKNFEILLIDDGSTDKSGKICDSFSDKRVKALHQTNKGVSAARNNGLDHASGEWIMFVDSDDYIHPDMITFLLNLCKTYGSLVSQCGMVRGNDISFPKEVVSEKIRKWKFYELYSSPGRRYCGCVWGTLFHSSLFEQLRFPLGRAIAEDEYVAFFAMYQSKFVTITNRHMYYYFMSPISATRSRREHVNLDVVDTYEEIISYLGEKKEDRLINIAKKELCIRVMMHYVIAVKERMSDNDLQKLLGIFRKYYEEIDLSSIPVLERSALMLFKHIPRTFAFLENHLQIIYGNKLAREKR